MNSIKYIKNPITKDELEIAFILEEMIGATIYSNIKKLSHMYSTDAVIVVPVNKKLLKFSLKEYVTLSNKPGGNTHRIRRMMFIDVDIKIKNNEDADVSCTRHIQFLDLQRGDKFIRRFYKFKKYNNFWKISESLPG